MSLAMDFEDANKLMNESGNDIFRKSSPIGHKTIGFEDSSNNASPSEVREEEQKEGSHQRSSKLDLI